MQENKTKPKRRLSNIDFTKTGAHLALCSKDQGAANNFNKPLIIKSVKFSEEMITKMQEVRVTLDFPDFLRKFFGMYYEDALVLAKVLGYVEPDTSELVDYNEYIDSKVQSIEIMKSVLNATDISNVLSTVSAEEYLQLLKDQQMLEALICNQDISKESKPVKSEEDTSVASEVKGRGIPSEYLNKGKEMSDKIQIETVEKAAFDSLKSEQAVIQKALNEAIEELAVFKAKEQERVLQEKTQKMKAVIDQESILQPILKAALSLSGEDFEAVIKAVQALKDESKKADLFLEKGANEHQPEGQELDHASQVKARILKSRAKTK
jgi:hypothetical protein